uniref:uncharacterized protein LOC122587839 n=1 Tax=Erigeron canadensis TaxID=72917 RepID=UPI001CB91E73|nr:uncharacterized protein LOC122587839 [Erigeron canadensis]
MSSSASSTTNNRLSSSSRRRKSGVCNCNPPQRLKEFTSWTRRNPNRRFLGCRSYNASRAGYCEYFDWVDPELPDERYKEAMNELHQVSEGNREAEFARESHMVTSLKENLVEQKKKIKIYQTCLIVIFILTIIYVVSM